MVAPPQLLRHTYCPLNEWLIAAMTTKMVRVKMDWNNEQIGKYNPSVTLVQIGDGNHYVMKPKLHSKEWEVVERYQPK